MQTYNSKFVNEVISLFEHFLEVEKPLFEREITGFKYWHFIRFIFILEIFNAKNWIERETILQQSSLIDKISIGFQLFQNSIKHNIQKDNFESDLLVLNSPNKREIHNKLIDPYTDTWLNELSIPFTNWEPTLNWRHLKQELEPSLFYLDSLHIRSIINHIFSRKYKKIILEESNFLCVFAKQFNVDLNVNKINHIIANVISKHQFCSKLIKDQLEKKQVKLIVLINHYDPLIMLITSIAKTLGAYIIEIQHGSMGKFHIAYNFKYEEPLDALPNEIFTFGQFWNDTTRIKNNGVKLTSTGMPYFEEKISSLSPPKKNGKIKILFISQDTVGRFLSQIAIELSEKLDLEKYEIWYKMHPREYSNWQKFYSKELSKSDIKVLTNSDIYELMNISDIHIGVYSTTIIESLVFNKKLILVKSYGVHFFLDLIENGRAFFARNVDEVISAIYSQKSQSGLDISYFWENNSKNNITQRINTILES